MSSIVDAHCLMELSQTEWKRWKDSSIHVSGRVEKLEMGTKHILYKNIKVGKKIEKMKKKSMCNGRLIWWEEINLAVMKHGLFLITTPKDELLAHTTVQIVDTVANSDNHKPSGVVVLLICRLDSLRDRTGWAWGYEHFKCMKESKPNIIGGSLEHFGSEGHYYSYGNKGNFGIVDGSSVGQYVNKKYKNATRTTKALILADLLEEMAAREFAIGIDGLCKVVPKLKSLIAPIITQGYDLQDKKGMVNLKQIPASKSGLWQTSISVNAQTKKLHTENDATYTIITVPKQEQSTQKNDKRQYTFLFKLQNKTNMCIKLRSGITFCYSGKLLTHHQTCNMPCSPEVDMFVNFGSYGTQRLYRHMRTSFNRNASK